MMSSKIQNSRNAVFCRKLFSLVLPIAFQQFMLAAVSVSDALMLMLDMRTGLPGIRTNWFMMFCQQIKGKNLYLFIRATASN
ncbi:MAG TPA: hypothetical protein H9775_04070 [Candidatus Blautia merdipullorum]|nr:hypothetical protein [Candidatus Blautia merdipullorum]